jgi:hypothetical protein
MDCSHEPTQTPTLCVATLREAWNAADLLARVATSTERILHRRMQCPASGDPREDWIEVHADIADARMYLAHLVELLDDLPSPPPSPVAS